MIKIKIFTESSGYFDAVINDEENPKTAREIINALPIKSKLNTWGNEVYFKIPVDLDEENALVEVGMGALAYWPPGNSFCIFFGRTPASRGEKPAAASPVNVFGKTDCDPEVLKSIHDGETITIELAKE